MGFSSQIQVRMDGRVEALGLEAAGHPARTQRIRLIPLASHGIVCKMLNRSIFVLLGYELLTSNFLVKLNYWSRKTISHHSK